MNDFRGFTLDGEEVRGWYCKIDGVDYIIAEDAYFGDGVELGDIIGARGVLPDSVGQSTGLKDKNEKEIYGSIPINGKMSKGGDVMNFKSDKSSPSGGYYAGTVGFHPENAKVVEWDEDRWVVGSFRLSTQLQMFEVVGDEFEMVVRKAKI